MLKLPKLTRLPVAEVQPPSGGCVLKHEWEERHNHQRIQPPSGGCVLKQSVAGRGVETDEQPPSGGCVLKQ